MENFPTLKNPPIVEAIIEIIFKKIDNEEPDEIAKKLNIGIIETIPHKDIHINQTGDQHSVIVSDSNQDRIIKKNNSKNIIFIRKLSHEPKISLSFHLLEKYESHDAFFSEFRNIISRISQNKPLEISRIGLRYINKFEFNPGDWDKSIKFQPKLENNYSAHDHLSNATNFVLYSPKQEARANVNVLFAMNFANKMECLFDIDSFLERAPDPMELDEVIKSLKKEKSFINEIFFSNIVSAKLQEFDNAN